MWQARLDLIYLCWCFDCFRGEGDVRGKWWERRGVASGDYKSDTNRRDQMQTSLLIVDSRVTLLFSQFSLNVCAGKGFRMKDRGWTILHFLYFPWLQVRIGGGALNAFYQLTSDGTCVNLWFVSWNWIWSCNYKLENWFEILLSHANTLHWLTALLSTWHHTQNWKLHWILFLRYKLTSELAGAGARGGREGGIKLTRQRIASFDQIVSPEYQGRRVNCYFIDRPTSKSNTEFNPRP